MEDRLSSGIGNMSQIWLVLAACHKFGQGDRVRSLHVFSKSACVGEG